MKKIFSAFVIAVCCMFMAMPAQAQLLKWGVKGGVNMTKIDWDGGYKGNKDNSTGFFIGPMAEITIPIVPNAPNILFIFLFFNDTHTPIINNNTDIIPIGLNKLIKPLISCTPFIPPY